MNNNWFNPEGKVDRSLESNVDPMFESKEMKELRRGLPNYSIDKMYYPGKSQGLPYKANINRFCYKLYKYTPNSKKLSMDVKYNYLIIYFIFAFLLILILKSKYINY